MTNQTVLIDNLPDNIAFSIVRNANYDNPGSNNNDPSAFNFLFNNSYYLNEFGIFDAFCLQPWIPINDTIYTANLYYITEDFSISTNVDLNQDLIINETFYFTDELLQAATFVLNNLSWEQLDADAALEGVIRDDAGNILNPTDASGNYIYLEIADVQYVVWDLIYGIYAPDYAGGGIFDETGYGVRALDSTTNAILKSNIAPHAANYVADEAGDKLGFIIQPNSYHQHLFSTIELSAVADHFGLDTTELIDMIAIESSDVSPALPSPGVDAGFGNGTVADETDTTESSPMIPVESPGLAPSVPVPVPESSSIIGLLAIAISMILTTIKN